MCYDIRLYSGGDIGEGLRFPSAITNDTAAYNNQSSYSGSGVYISNKQGILCFD